jgi:S1-C subfamily serine protease
MQTDAATQPGQLGRPAPAGPARAAPHLGLRIREGLVVSEVTSAGPADDAGLREARSLERGVPRGGDVLLEIDGAPLAETGDLTAALERLSPGEEVELTVLREGRRTTSRRRRRETPGA